MPMMVVTMTTAPMPGMAAFAVVMMVMVVTMTTAPMPGMAAFAVVMMVMVVMPSGVFREKNCHRLNQGGVTGQAVTLRILPGAYQLGGLAFGFTGKNLHPAFPAAPFPFAGCIYGDVGPFRRVKYCFAIMSSNLGFRTGCIPK
ncbi:hypothetical protein AGMMS49944_11580 [Spirochaetia bacterium]|nr:hypothetical protein AGMMS49944_11580 [Spirochaetia bacterium]